MTGVAISLSKLIFPAVISLIKFSDPASAAPASFASPILLSSHKTAILTFFPLPCGRFTTVLKLASSFFCFKFKFNETSIDSSNLAVQFSLIFFIPLLKFLLYYLKKF